MKYSYGWLKELSGTKLPIEKAAELLTMHSFEVENVEKVGNANLRSVVVGEILEINKHPNADKLQLVKVNVGETKIPLNPPFTKGELQIVCGAWNIKVGDKVPVALVGTKLPGGEIKEVEIRGVKSYGMLCAEDELGLGDDHSGIIILDKNAKIGSNAFDYLSVAKDETFEIKVLADRAHDAMSYIGVAREIAVLEGKKLEFAKAERIKANKSKKIHIKIEDNELCPRYIGAVMENIEVKESPEWMRERLIFSGLRPINNVVDATNYVMLEIGQPLHAFDFDKLAKAERIEANGSESVKIVVRRAKNKERLILLDDSEIELKDSDLLITNGENPLALAGVMGGKNSGINENTKTIILEAANFNAINIRKTRTRLNIKTDASDRFEKDIDSNLAEKAMARVIEILEDIAGGKLEGVVDEYPKPVKPWTIKLDLNYVNNLLGEIISIKDVVRTLEALDIEIKNQKSKIKIAIKNSKIKDTVECIVPTIRIDLKTQEDLIEEIGRIYGYEKIESQPIVAEVHPAKVSDKIKLERKIKDILAALGFDEVLNYSFYSRTDADNYGLNGLEHLELENPQSPEQELLRISLIPNLIKNVRENLKNYASFDVFEMGKVFFSDKSKGRIEKNYISGVSVFEKKARDNFFVFKGNLEALFEKLYLGKINFKNTGNKIIVEINNREIGSLQKISENVLNSFEVKRFQGEVYSFELDFDTLKEVLPKQILYTHLDRYPRVLRDISFLLDKNEITAKELSEFIQKSGGKYLLKTELFDVFEKEGKTSYAYHLEFGTPERTLESVEADEALQKIISDLEKELNVEIRK